MKLIRLIHKWTGLFIGLFLFISCLTGTFILIGRLTKCYAPIFRWMETLHTSLFLNETGSYIIGIATLLLLFEIITGYLLWWREAKGQMQAAGRRGQSRWQGFRRSLRWNFPNKVLGLHVAGGFWSGIPLVIMALTGLTWCFGWFGNFVYGLFDPNGDGNLFHTIAALHTGSFLGTFSRIVWLLFSLLGASLPVTGYLIFFRKRHK